MRDLRFKHYAAAAVPVLAAAFGIYHWAQHPDTGLTIPLSELASTQGSRKIASVAADKKGSRKVSRESSADEQDEDDTEEGAARTPASDSRPSAALEAAANDAVTAGADCAKIEYRGDGPQLTQITKADWSRVMEDFHSAKHSLTEWLERHRAEITVPAYQVMEHRLGSVKIQRPPVLDEPDLAWRGIGVYGQNPEGEPIIKLGGGFVQLSVAHPARARFELTRLVAQTWSPCELLRFGALEATWSPLLKCLGMTQAQDCSQGTYSESGWAVSTTIAAAVQPPSCQIEAFKSPEASQCVSHIPFAVMTAQNGAGQASGQPSVAAERSVSSVSEGTASQGGHP